MARRKDRIGSSCWYRVGNKWATGTVRAWLVTPMDDVNPPSAIALVEYGPYLRIQPVPASSICFAAVPPGPILENIK